MTPGQYNVMQTSMPAATVTVAADGILSFEAQVGQGNVVDAIIA